jgi:hypothetical protein
MSNNLMDFASFPSPNAPIVASNRKGKQLIPWRDPSRGPTLRLAMFKLAAVERIYFKAPDDKRKSDERWQDFATKLFAQPEFLGMEGSFRRVKDQYDLTLKVAIIIYTELN